MTHKCPHCDRPFKSKSGMRRHIKSAHVEQETIEPKAEPQEKPVAANQDAQLMSEAGMVQAALKDLGIKKADVMSYRVYTDKVVVIEGPTGWKRVWRPKEE